MNRRAMFEAIASESTSRLSSSTSGESAFYDGWSKGIENIIAEAEQHLIDAEAKQDRLIEQMYKLQSGPSTASIYRDDLDVLLTLMQSTEMERLKGELQRTKGQCELVKKLLADATAEKDIMYEVGVFTEI